jgi:hypothetical protein
LEVLRYGLDGAGAPHISLAATSPENLAFGSGSPLVTSNSTTPGSGIVWISQCTSSPACEGSTLNAYAAVPVAGAPRLLWKGDIGVSTKFARPDASGGRIYVGTRDGQVLAFGATHHTLTVAREESAGGLVRSDVSGIDCGSSCSHSFADGTRVTLNATPSNHFEFTGWSGGACSGTGPCQLSMYSDVSVTASFARITHSVTVAKSGTGAGAVTSSPAGIACGTICSARFEAGGDVTLEANLSNSAVSWSGCTSVAANICRITDLEADRQVTASFVGLPKTSLTRAKIDRSRRYATFRFRGAGADGGFQCRLVRPRVKHHKRTPSGFSKCTSPKAFRHLSHGHYVFEVRAINAAGPDPTPAKRRFRI